jgi:hypothetical protein
MGDRLENEAQEWIEAISGRRFRGETFADSLKDGVILCQCVTVPASTCAHFHAQRYSSQLPTATYGLRSAVLRPGVAVA